MRLLLFAIVAIFLWSCKKIDAQVPNNPGKGIILVNFNGFKPKLLPWGRPAYGNLLPAKLNDSMEAVILNKVRLYFVNWDVQITTNPNIFYKFPLNKRVRVTVTRTVLTEYSNFGFINYPGGESFYNQLYLGDTTTCLISIPNLSDSIGPDARAISDAIAHEVGHSLGLAHQSSWNKRLQKTDEYNPGDKYIAPIMGVSYESEKAIWWKGLNSFMQYQNDEEIISKTWLRVGP